MSHMKKAPKQCLSGGCVMGTYLTFNCTYLVSTATYYCKLSYKTIPTGTDHGDICLAGIWLHKERFLRTSSIVTWVGVGHVWQARLMRWLLIIIEMLINEQMIYNHHTVTKQWGSNILDFELLVKAWNIAWRFTFHATLFWTEHSLLSDMLDTLISPFYLT